MTTQEKKILNLVDRGVISASEANQLLNSLARPAGRACLKLEIFSSRQTSPLFFCSYPADKISELGPRLESFRNSELEMILESGRFKVDFKRFNWSRIMDLAKRDPGGSIYYRESIEDEDSTISLKISVDK